MSAQRKDGLETRQRLLEPASEVFAQKGFRDATIAEICREAGANVAAVNYHFGSKGELYVEAGKLWVGHERAGQYTAVNQAVRSRVLRGPGREKICGRFVDSLVKALGQLCRSVRATRRYPCAGR